MRHTSAPGAQARRIAPAFLLVLAATLAGARAAPAAAAAVALPLEDGVVPRPGFDLHYTVVGAAGPYLVVLSGGPGEEVRSMQEIADELGKTHRCVMLEQRGTGRSRLATYDPSTINLAAYVEDLEALRHHLGVDRLLLLGNSWGMMLALTYGGVHPQHVLGVITLGSGPITRAYLGVFSDNLASRLPAENAAVVRYWSDPARAERDLDRATFERVRATVPAYFFDRQLAFAYAMELPADEFNPRIVPAFLAAEKDFDLRPLLRAITAPTLLLQGRQDIAGEANIGEAHQLIHGSQLVFIDRCGHMPWLEQPAQTWKAVAAFLAGIER
ncbi:MAG TPA: alpha/beta hydrolase [Thermoanaerobaculia bacterium]|nr:alpha/beta hydrolase [Thermoanaerobaculia bacterium]